MIASALGPLRPSPPPPDGKTRRGSHPHSQTAVSRFWSNYHSKTPGKVTSIFPRKLYKGLASSSSSDARYGNVRNAAQSYEEARANCLAMVRHAVLQCERTNTKFTDFEFDIETDHQTRDLYCLLGLPKLDDEDSSSDDEAVPGASPQSVTRPMNTLIRSGVLGNTKVVLNVYRLEKDIGECDSTASPPHRYPLSVHRLSWIFESPQFTVNGFSSSDIKQGSIGDCWWLAAVSNIAHRRDLMEKICVGRDEECGVYGFVFHRDGEWISTIIDDNLYVTHEDFGLTADVYDSRGKKARLHKKQKQTGSEALFFSKCEDENETWLPLLEKAYAKVHGDYDAIDFGWAGSAVEDLTGGVTTLILANRVLRKDRLWREMLSINQENGEFVFGLSTSADSLSDRKNGLILSHAYSVLEATEVADENGNKVRLLKIRNPWGQRSDSGFGDWHGPWSDGSKEWTPYMIRRLRHEFADHGVFYMSFDDVLNNFKWIHRTRLFDGSWTVAQQWTSDPISWVAGYSGKRFIIEVNHEGFVVIVLSNLDTRYFKGLEGQYWFHLEFILRETNSPRLIAEAQEFPHSDTRSVNCEVYLQPGTYEVLPKITAGRERVAKSVEQMIRIHADKNPKKLRQVGLQYDIAHAKAGVLDEDAEQERTKRIKGQGQQDKLYEMRDAMTRMQVAMSNMQEQLNKKEKQEKVEESGTNDGNAVG